jgi:hypothetical protein
MTPTAQGHALAKLAAEALGVDRVLVAVDRRRDTAPAVADAFTTAFARHKPKAPPPPLRGAQGLTHGGPWERGEQPPAGVPRRLGFCGLCVGFF